MPDAEMGRRKNPRDELRERDSPGKYRCQITAISEISSAAKEITATGTKCLKIRINIDTTLPALRRGRAVQGPTENRVVMSNFPKICNKLGANIVVKAHSRAIYGSVIKQG